MGSDVTVVFECQTCWARAATTGPMFGDDPAVIQLAASAGHVLSELVAQDPVKAAEHLHTFDIRYARFPQR